MRERSRELMSDEKRYRETGNIWARPIASFLNMLGIIATVGFVFSSILFFIQGDYGISVYLGFGAIFVGMFAIHGISNFM